MKYRKKPVVIEAIRFDSANPEKGKEFCAGINTRFDGMAAMYLETLEGTMRCLDGDWIIKGVAGEFYPCKPDIFDQTYEKV